MAKHDRAEVLPVESNGPSEGRVCVSSTIGTGRDMVDPFPVFSTYKCTGHVVIVQVREVEEMMAEL